MLPSTTINRETINARKLDFSTLQKNEEKVFKVYRELSPDLLNTLKTIKNSAYQAPLQMTIGPKEIVQRHQSSDVLSGTPSPIPKGLTPKKFLASPTLYNSGETNATGNWKMHGTA